MAHEHTSTTTLAILRAEHNAIAAVLDTIRQIAHRMRESIDPPQFEALRTLIFYLDSFPERLHHPKETKYIFKLLRCRTSEADAVLDILENDHKDESRRIREIEHQLLELEMLGPPFAEAFIASVESFCDWYWQHIRQEEKEVFPLANTVLNAEDWSVIGAAFSTQRDPLTGFSPEIAYEGLIRRVLRILPAPLGLGTSI